jgi:DNA replication and repair protein RecF
VRLDHLRLRDFRNYAYLDADFGPGFHLFLGNNAQGKTNLLEAIYLLATLRSFRGATGAQMIRFGAKGYFAGASLSGQTHHDVKLFWSSRTRQITLDGLPVKRLMDYYGLVRAVVFCSEDLLLIKGTSRVRRRFLDLLLAQTEPGYLAVLQRYMQTLKARNALLKQLSPDAASIESFTRELIASGNQLRRYRGELVPRFSPLARLACGKIASESDELKLEYSPSVRNDFATELAQSRGHERASRTTVIGPHRDDLSILINDRPAAQFSSEGQKRTLAIALKMAQAEFLSEAQGTPPILLIDDVMGELDVHRRSGFLPLLEKSRQCSGQVFMTCTEENWPRELGRTITRWTLRSGELVKP